MINLLPEEEKKELVIRKKKTIILILGIELFVFIISLTLILLSINIYISSQVESQEVFLFQEEKRFQESEEKSFQEKLDFFNREILYLKFFYEKNKTSFNEILTKVSSALPRDVFLTSLNVDSSQISLSGFASNRESLIEIKNNLEKDENFEQVEISPASWLNPEEFFIKITIKK